MSLDGSEQCPHLAINPFYRQCDWKRDRELFGRRILNVMIGGTKFISNLDIFAMVGKNRGYDVTIPVTVTNGILKIDFVTVVDNGRVSAILVQNR